MTFVASYDIPVALPPDAWLKDAACTPEVAEYFWPIGDKLTWANREALRICSHCPAIRACGQWAIENRLREGIWGGMRPDQLRRLIARQASGWRDQLLEVLSA